MFRPHITRLHLYSRFINVPLELEIIQALRHGVQEMLTQQTLELLARSLQYALLHQPHDHALSQP